MSEKEKGRVVEIKGNLAVVTLTRREACAKCRACSAGFTSQEMRIEADNLCEAKVGDWVELSLAENGFLGAVKIMYGIPMIGLMAGLLLGYFVLWPVVPMLSRELLSFGLGMVGVLIAYLWIHSQKERWEQKKYRPAASKITEPDPQPSCN